MPEAGDIVIVTVVLWAGEERDEAVAALEHWGPRQCYWLRDVHIEPSGQQGRWVVVADAVRYQP